MKNDWEKFGDEIVRNIQKAIDNRDYSRLSQTINDTVNQAMENATRGMKNGGWYRDPNNGGTYSRNPNDANSQSGTGGAYGAQRNDSRRYANQGQGNWDAGCAQGSGSSRKYELKKRETQLYMKGTPAKVGGVILSVTGYTFGISTTLLTLLGTAAFGAAIAVGGGLAAVAFFGMGIWGSRMLGHVGRFGKYVSTLRGREYCDIKELAEKTGYSVKKVTKDLKKMIQTGWFRQGHLDEKETCLMASNEAYQQYMGLMDHMRQEKEEKEAREKAQHAEEQRYSHLDPEVQKVIREGDEYVKKIRRANDAIPGEEISAKISRMEMLVDRIFDRVEQNPEMVSELHKLMDYYLPTTVKLLDAYAELDAEPVQGENILSSKQEIEKTMDTLNTAFEKILDSLFLDTAWDVSSDISVLHTVLAQEGLTEDEMTK